VITGGVPQKLPTHPQVTIATIYCPVYYRQLNIYSIIAIQFPSNDNCKVLLGKTVSDWPSGCHYQLLDNTYNYMHNFADLNFVP